ncbi:calcium-activated chloride channel regulator 2-like [Pyxicephalus adspersus]|uniref:calcium-activated chloride channel regulator 2-like n=1 Tax=Pyxicephalus adspersus TaxID=30357 RepID=UPI003B599305
MLFIFYLFFFSLLQDHCNAKANVQLRDNGYEEILIAIHPQVPQDLQIISNLKNMITEASHYIFNATKRRFFYRKVKILMPPNWKLYNVQKPRHETHQMANVIISNPNAYYGNDPYTLHYEGCGNEGQYIHFTPDFLTDDRLIPIYGPRELNFKSIIVAEFCYEHDHEKEAPNMQNKMCSYRSTWDVISSSYDYKSTLPMSGTDLPSPPSFSIMQVKKRVVCLVLDVSENMAKSERLNQMHRAAAIFIQQIVEEGTYVGIVTFNETAEVKNHLLQIVSDDIRMNLTSNLPVKAGGGMSICSGILSGLQVIKGFDGGTEGSEIILAVSGNDGNIHKCLSEVSHSGSVIHTIPIGPNADPELEQIAEITGGLNIYASDTKDSDNLIGGFIEISSKYKHIGEPFVVIKSIQKLIKAGSDLFGSVFLDRSVGNDTTFIITWQASEPPDVIMENSTGFKFKYIEHDNTSRVSYLKIPGTAQSATWLYRIKNTLNDTQALGVLVISRPSSEVLPFLRITAGKINNTITSPHPVILFAEVKHGFTAVLGANVTAVIEPETGDPLTLTLLDDGAGADFSKGDGIYSIYLFRFTNNGRYTLKMYAEWTNATSLKPPQSSHALYVPGYIENDAINMNPPRPIYKGQSTNEMFSRVLFLGSFKVMNVSQNFLNKDVFPPCKITDLEAKIESEHVILFWTAPGDDYDQGAASNYDIRISTSPNVLRQHFSRATVINASYIKPKNGGSRETFTFRLGNKTAEHGSITYIAIRSADKTGQRSEVSNLVHVTRPKVQVEDISQAYATIVVNSSTTTVIIAAALAVCLCLAIGAGVYSWRKCLLYKITNGTIESGSKYRVIQEARHSTAGQSEEFCLQVMSNDDVVLINEPFEE